MLAARELVALVYRADWTRLSLSGEVSGLEEPLITVITHLLEDPDLVVGSFPPFVFGWPAPRSSAIRW